MKYFCGSQNNNIGYDKLTMSNSGVMFFYERIYLLHSM